MKLLHWIKDQFLHVFPVFVFFLIMFSIINATEMFLFKRAGMTTFSFLYIAVTAAVIAKVILVIDNLPLVNLFPNKPLIFTTLWKTGIYWAINLCVRLAIRFTPFLFSGEGFPSQLNTFSKQMDWPLFKAIQVWYLMLFFLFVVSRELILAIGPVKVRKLFFGR